MSALRKMNIWKLAILAFLAMCMQDLLATVMVVQEANYNPYSAGAFDAAGWLFGIVCSGLALNEVFNDGWKSKRALTIILAVSAANFIGTVIGVDIARAIHHR